MSKKGATKTGNPNSKERGKRAGVNAPATPKHRAGKTSLSDDIKRRLKDLGLSQIEENEDD